MPNVTMPDGTVVEMPDKLSPEQGQRLRALQESKGKQAASPPAAAKPPEERGLIERGVDTMLGPLGQVLKGAAEVPRAMAGGALGSAAGNVTGAATALMSDKRGTPAAMEEGRQAGEKVSSAITEKTKPTTAFGQQFLEKFGHLFDESKLAGLNPATPLGTVPGARALEGAAGTATKIGSAAVEGVEGAARSKLSPELIAYARKAQELGIQIPPHKLTDNRFLRLVGEALDNMPASGSVSEKNQVAFSSALGKLIGAPEGTKRIGRGTFDQAITQSGQSIGDIASRAKLTVSREALTDINAIVTSTEKFDTPDVASVVKNYADELLSKSTNGTIEGEAFRKWNTDIGGKIRRTSNGDLRYALGDLQEKAMDLMESGLSKQDLSRWQESRKQYAIAKAIEPLVAKAPGGDIPPSQLMGVLNRGKEGQARMARGHASELGDLADVAQMFLRDQPSSITAERGLAYGMLGMGAVEPTSAAGAYGAANVYNRIGPKITRRLTKVKDLTPEDQARSARELSE